MYRSCRGERSRPGAADRMFKYLSDQTKDYKIGVRCFPDKKATGRKKSKDWLACNQYNMSDWIDILL